MNEFQKSVLKALITKYENSVLSREGSQRSISIALTTKDKVLEKYAALDSYKYSEKYTQDLRELEAKGYVFPIFDKYDAFQEVDLNLDCVNEVYQAIGAENPKLVCSKYIRFLSSYNTDGFLKEYISNLIEKIRTTFRVPKKLESISDLKIVFDLVGLVKSQEDDIMERDFSIKYLGDSKKFADYRNRVCHLIFDNDPEYPYSDEEFHVDRVLSYFNITKNSSAVIVRNNLKFRIHNQVIDLNDYQHDFYLSDESIRDMEILDSAFDKVITIENLTSFRKYHDKDAIIIYLAGFNNHTKQMLLKKLYEKYPDKKYLHFSDIDCGGFLIFNHLVESTGIPFMPLHMDVEELKESSVVLKPLTQNDVSRLNKLLVNEKFSCFKDVIEYMLSIGKKLEQESLDELLN